MGLKSYECSRCKEDRYAITMSRFNTEMICEPCKSLEEHHPLYSIACEIELLHIRLGNLNFEGIGLPRDYHKHVEKSSKSDETGL